MFVSSVLQDMGGEQTSDNIKDLLLSEEMSDKVITQTDVIISNKYSYCHKKAINRNTGSTSKHKTNLVLPEGVVLNLIDERRTQDR